jgi:hypothetical protein
MQPSAYKRQWELDYLFALESRGSEPQCCGGFTWLAGRGALLLKYLPIK